MPREKKSSAKTNGNGANLGFEATLWGRRRQDAQQHGRR
jgi:hypothetical protein